MPAILLRDKAVISNAVRKNRVRRADSARTGWLGPESVLKGACEGARDQVEGWGLRAMKRQLLRLRGYTDQHSYDFCPREDSDVELAPLMFTRLVALCYYNIEIFSKSVLDLS